MKKLIIAATIASTSALAGPLCEQAVVVKLFPNKPMTEQRRDVAKNAGRDASLYILKHYTEEIALDVRAALAKPDASKKLDMLATGHCESGQEDQEAMVNALLNLAGYKDDWEA